jgi:excisionase family DNA binding protein
LLRFDDTIASDGKGEQAMSTVLDEAVSPSEQDAKIAQESSRRLSRFAKEDRLALQLPAKDHAETETIELPRAVVGLLMRILTEMAEGNAVTLMPIHAELTTQQAASILGVSRPFLIKQMKEKKIPYRQIGTHRRVRFQDLMEYKNRIDASRAKVLEELAAQAQELNMGY